VGLKLPLVLIALGLQAAHLRLVRLLHRRQPQRKQFLVLAPVQQGLFRHLALQAHCRARLFGVDALELRFQRIALAHQRRVVVSEFVQFFLRHQALDRQGELAIRFGVEWTKRLRHTFQTRDNSLYRHRYLATR
jgi:hypothetical protein